MRTFLLMLCILVVCASFAQDSTYLRIHFLYGSKPLKQYKDTEPKWFGGILGGHVGIESDHDRIVNFVPQGSFHLIDKKNNRHSAFTIHSQDAFYGILGGNPDSVKKAIVVIPVTWQQKRQFDSIAAVYLQQTPYDYALVGMRCGAAAYDMLAQINVLPDYSYKKTYAKIIYPQKLRKRLFHEAGTHGWTIIRQEGSTTRKWEGDKGSK